MALAALGMGDPGGEDGLYTSCLQAITSRQLSAQDVRIAMVCELAVLTHVHSHHSHSHHSHCHFSVRFSDQAAC